MAYPAKAARLARVENRYLRPCPTGASRRASRVRENGCALPPASMCWLKSVATKHRPGRITQHEIQELPRFGTGPGGQGDGIDDRGMAGFGKLIDDAHALLGERIGSVHDSKRGFTASHKRKRGTDIFSAHNPARHRSPHSELLQRDVSVLTDRHRIRIARSELPITQRARKTESRADLQGHLAVGRRNQYESVEYHIMA